MKKQKMISFKTEEQLQKLIEDGHHIDGIFEKYGKSMVIYTPGVIPKQVNPELTQELEKIVDRWNNAKIINKHKLPGLDKLPSIRKITPTMKSFYKTKRDVYKYEEIIQGIINYIRSIEDRKLDNDGTVFSHIFTLQDFLGRKGGLDRFINL